MTQQFPSKRDTWLTVVLFASIAALGLAAGLSVFLGRWLVAGTLILPGAAMLWIFVGTHYTVTDSELISRAGLPVAEFARRGDEGQILQSLSGG